MNTKDILTEWHNFINKNLLLEISKNEVIEVIGEDDYNTLVKTNKKASQDQNFLQVIINTYNSDQNHSIEDILGSYQNYTRFIASKWNQGEEASVDVPGGHRASLTPDSTTYDDILKFIDASQSMNLKSKAYINCLKQGPVNSDFEVVINDSDWIICYPKTIKGSISLARSFWNGSELEYDRSVSGGVGKMIGKMNWCTSIVSGGNMFLNYHRRKNLHMYYCIKKNMSVEDLDRKLCISFSKNNNNVKLMEGQTSVNANNSMTSEEEFKTYIGERFDVLFNDVKNPDRLEIDEKAYYESISLEQYKILRAANEDDLQNFVEELEGILAYSIDKKEIGLLALKEKNKVFKLSLAKSSNLMELDPSGELIKKLAFDKKVNVRLDIASFQDLLGADPSGELIKKLAFDKNKKIRIAIAEKQDLLGADPSGELIKSLASDANKNIRIAMSRRQDLLKLDPSGGLFKKLAADKNKDVRGEIASRQDLLELDPSGELIKQVVFNGDEHFKTTFVSTQNILELDPSGELIKKLAFDNNIHVRLDIASFQDLLGADPSGELIKKLASDKSEFIRNAVLNRYNIDNLSRLSSNANESLLRSYIKYLL